MRFSSSINDAAELTPDGALRQRRPGQRWTQWRSVIGLIVLATLVRGGVLWARFDDLRADPDGYREIADAVQGAKLYGRRMVISRQPLQRWALLETAYRPPLYPYALVAVAGERALTPLRIALFHLGLGVASVLLTYHLAQTWGLARNVALLAALLVACDPILLRQSTLVMTETLATFVALLTLVALTRFMRRPEPFEAALVGVALGVSILCRPTFMAFATIVVASVPCLTTSLPRRVLNFAACLAITAVVIAPWAWRNKVDLGTPVVTTTHGGYTLVLGNNEYFYDHLRRGGWHTPWDSEKFGLDVNIFFFSQLQTKSAHREIKEDRAAYTAAFLWIRDDPAMFVVSCVYRIWRLWSPLAMPLSTSEATFVRAVRYAAAAWYVAVFACAAIGAWRLRGGLFKTPWLWGVLLCVSFTLVHTFFWSDMRMRAPLMPVVALLAAVGCQAIVNRGLDFVSKRSFGAPYKPEAPAKEYCQPTSATKSLSRGAAGKLGTSRFFACASGWYACFGTEFGASRTLRGNARRNSPLTLRSSFAVASKLAATIVMFCQLRSRRGAAIDHPQTASYRNEATFLIAISGS